MSSSTVLGKRKSINSQESKRKPKKLKTEKIDQDIADLHKIQVQHFIADNIENSFKKRGCCHCDYGIAEIHVACHDFPWLKCDESVHFQELDILDTINNYSIMSSITSIYKYQDNWDISFKKIEYNDQRKQYEIMFEAKLKNHQHDKKDLPSFAMTTAQDLVSDITNLLDNPPTDYDTKKSKFLVPGEATDEHHYRLRVPDSTSYSKMSYDQMYNICTNRLVENELEQIEKDWSDRELMLPIISFETTDLNIQSMTIKSIDVAVKEK